MQNHLTKEQKMVKNGDYVEIIGGKFGRVLYIGKVSGMLGEAIGLELSKPEGTPPFPRRPHESTTPTRSFAEIQS